MTKELGFDEAVAFVIDVLEGGDALIEDTGGRTRFGISQRAHPAVNVMELTRERAISIYHEQYWKPAGCDMLSWPLSLVAFDTAVNHGVSVAIKMRLAAYNWAELLMMRVERYKQLRDQDPKYHPPFMGWIDRCITLYRKAKGA